MRKVGPLAAAVALLLTILLPGPNAAPVAAVGPQCAVPTTAYPTIQAAVDDLSCSTITVAAGAYVESVSINRPLILDGASQGVDARTRNNTTGESIIDPGGSTDLTISADNVTVDGFTLLGPTNQGYAALVLMGPYSGEMIENNIIQNPGRAASFSTSSTTFRQNAVHATATAGDGFQENTLPASDVTIADNSFDGGVAPGYHADVSIIGPGFQNAPVSSNIIVTGNSSTGDNTLAALYNTDTAQISGNTVSGASGPALYIGGGDSNIAVNANRIFGGASPAINIDNYYGDGPNSNINVTLNTLAGNVYGVYIAATAIATAQTVAVHDNNFTGNTLFGVSDASTFTVDAGCNWWGDGSGPGLIAAGNGDRVSAGVTFAPWLIAAAPDGGCLGGNVPTDASQCMDDGWMTLVRADGSTFENESDCIQYVNTGQ